MKTSKERRQVELIALLTDSPIRLSVTDLCGRFNVEVATINRDLQELRERGIQIHSVQGSVRLIRQPSEKELRALLSLYISSVGNAISLPQNISLTVKKLKEKSLPTFVALVRAIEERRMAELTYYKMFDDETVVRVVEPHDLIPTSRNWRLIARSDGMFKQFFVENIREIKVLNERFRRSSEFNSSDLFRNSFEYWSGDEQYEVVLRFSKKVATQIKNGVWSEEQEIETQRDGSVLLRMKVNSLEEVGNWVMTWGGEVRVVEPETLKQQTTNKAKQIC